MEALETALNESRGAGSYLAALAVNKARKAVEQSRLPKSEQQ